MKKNLLKLFGIGLFVFILFRINLLELVDSIKKVNIYYIVTVLLLNIPLITIKALRWNMILKMQKIHISWMDNILFYFSGQYFGVVTPGRVGELIKALYLKLEKGVPVVKGMTSVLADRLLDMYLLIILGIIAIGQLGIAGKLSNGVIVLIVLVSLSPLLVLNKRLAGKGFRLLYDSVIIKKFKNKIEGTFEEFYEGVWMLINPKLIFPAILTCLGYVLFFFQCYLLVIGMGLQIDFITITFFMTLSSLVSMLPISISGLGTRDAALIYLFSLLNLEPELAVSYAFLVFITFFVGGGFMGAIAWWIKPITLKLSPSSV